jgi:hypothetical protein
VVDAGLGEHGVVLNLGLAKRGGVRADDNELGCERRKSMSIAFSCNRWRNRLTFARAEALQARFVAEGGLARPHYEAEARVDALHALFLWGNNFVSWRGRERTHANEAETETRILCDCIMDTSRVEQRFPIVE